MGVQGWARGGWREVIRVTGSELLPHPVGSGVQAGQWGRLRAHMESLQAGVPEENVLLCWQAQG